MIFKNSRQYHTIKNFLEEGVELHNNKEFIEHDPISIPHRFKIKEDIEISGFIASSLAWGNRTSIIKSATKFIDLMGNTPYDFIINHTESDKKSFKNFVHRTFNDDDALCFINALSDIYKNRGGLEKIITDGFHQGGILGGITHLNHEFFSLTHLKRSEKHIANPSKGSAAKRMNMFIRWMVRHDESEVDFGLWKHIPMSDLMCPLDVHSGNVARKLGILERKQNDWKAVIELTESLKCFCNEDPIKYDFALFGTGVTNTIKL